MFVACTRGTSVKQPHAEGDVNTTTAFSIDQCIDHTTSIHPAHQLGTWELGMAFLRDTVELDMSHLFFAVCVGLQTGFGSAPSFCGAYHMVSVAS